MSRIYLPLILILLIVFQGVTVQLVPPIFAQNDLIVVVHTVFLFLVLFKLFYDLENTYNALILAIFSGLIIDIIYTDIIGVYMFSYGVMIYFVHGMRRLLHTNFYTATLITLLSVGFVDFSLYFIYQLIGITQMELIEYLSNRLIPTLTINMIIFFIFYLLFKKKLVQWSNERFNQKGSTN